MALVRDAGLQELADEWLTVPTDKGANLGLKVASRFLANLGTRAPLLGDPGKEDFVFVDVDDTTIEVHGYAKQGSSYGYSEVRGLNVQLAPVSTKDTAQVIAAQRLCRARPTRPAAPSG